MKVFKYILKHTIWSVVALYLLLITLPRIPAIQAWLGQSVASVLQAKLGARVQVGSISLGFLNRIVIDDFDLRDQQGNHLLKVGRLSAKLELIPLTKGQVSISSAQLFNAHINAYRDSTDAPLNFQFLVDSLSASSDTTHTPLNLRIGSLIIRHSNITYNQLDKARKIGEFDPFHIHTSDVSAYIILKVLTDDSLNLNVKRLAFAEQSGLQVKRLSMEIKAGRHDARLDNFSLQLPQSTLCIDSLVATFDSQHFKETLSYKSTVSNTSITIRDLAFYRESLKERSEQIDITAAIRGTGTSIDIPRLAIHSADNQIQLLASGWANSLDKAPECYADMQLSTGIGNMNIHAQLNRQQLFSGKIETDSIDLRKLLDDKDLGTMAASLDISGSTSSINVQGTISRLGYKNYTYQDIRLDGQYADHSVTGNLSVDDPNIRLALEGRYAHDGKSRHAIRLTSYIHAINPYALHLTTSWKDAQFRGIVDADISGSNLNDAQGTVDLDDFELSDSLGQYKIDNIHLRTGYEDDKHYLKVDGDMGEADIWGQFDWQTLPQSIVNYVASKFPTLPGLPTQRRSTSNNFDISMQLDNTEWLSRIFGIPLTLDMPFSMQASVDDKNHHISLDGRLPMFTYHNSKYRDGMIRLSTRNGNMECEIGLAKVSEQEETIELSLNALASDNRLSTRIEWDNHAPANKAWKGQLNAVMQVYNNVAGKPEANIQLHPSHAYFDGTRWNIKPGNIIYTEDRLDVQHFSIEHGRQHLFINGLASRLPDDTLTVDMNSIDVGYIMDLVDFHSVDFSGKATGRASATQLFARPHLLADVRVDDFLFQKGRMGTLHAQARWNQEKEQIDITATADDGADAQTLVDGYVSPTREYIDLGIEAQGSHIEFLNSFTGNFLSNVAGHARGKVRLAGDLDNINLTGKLVVSGQATVNALATTYTLADDTVTLVPDDIQLHSIPVYDKYGNQAFLSGGIHHEHLTSLTFDLDANTDKLLAYDVGNFGDGLFCGKVFVQGTAKLRGRPGEVVISCDVTPSEGSYFTYNATSGSTISEQEFITWTDRKAESEQQSQPRTSYLEPRTSYLEPRTSYLEPRTSNLVPRTSKEPPIPQSQTTDLYLNFSINTTPDAELRILMDKRTNDYITMRGSGHLTANYHNKGAFNIFGNYILDSGTYGITIQNIIKKNFTFQQGGTIVFGGNPMEAGLNLKAVYTVNGVSLSDLGIGNSFTNNTVRVDCIMNILGQAGTPRVEFDFDMPNVNNEELQMIRSIISSQQSTNQQVLYLLGIGRFYTQGANNASDEQEYGQTELAMQSFLSGTISTQLNEVLSQVIKNDKWNFGANISTGNEGWHNAEYEGIISGRMLNNRLLINGQFGYRDNAATASPSFIGDFDIRYLLYPNGNLALKVYNQTNDRYFTRSSLNTQGLGIIMKRDFNSLRDLLTPRKKNKKAKQTTTIDSNRQTDNEQNK